MMTAFIQMLANGAVVLREVLFCLFASGEIHRFARPVRDHEALFIGVVADTHQVIGRVRRAAVNRYRHLVKVLGLFGTRLKSHEFAEAHSHEAYQRKGFVYRWAGTIRVLLESFVEECVWED